MEVFSSVARTALYSGGGSCAEKEANCMPKPSRGTRPSRVTGERKQERFDF
jgi:hypothetical protein